MKCSRVAFLSFIFAVASLFFAAACASAAHAQADHGQAAGAQSKSAQIDIGGGFYEAFSKGTAGNGTQQSASNNVGGMFELRYLKSRMLGVGMSYSINPTTQTFAPNGSYPTCGVTCANTPVSLSAYAGQLTFEWVPSMQIGKIRPYGIAGVGMMMTMGSYSLFVVNDTFKPDLVGGGGVDYSLTPRFGLRAQYRFSRFKAPNLATPYPATGAYTYYSEPIGGVFYIF